MATNKVASLASVTVAILVCSAPAPRRDGFWAHAALSFLLGPPITSAVTVNGGIAQYVERSDNGSRNLLEEILHGEETHADWLGSQLELIAQVGDAHYVAQRIQS